MAPTHQELTFALPLLGQKLPRAPTSQSPSSGSRLTGDGEQLFAILSGGFYTLDDILNHILMMMGRLLVTATAWVKSGGPYSTGVNFIWVMAVQVHSRSGTNRLVVVSHFAFRQKDC